MLARCRSTRERPGTQHIAGAVALLRLEGRGPGHTAKLQLKDLVEGRLDSLQPIIKARGFTAP